MSNETEVNTGLMGNKIGKENPNDPFDRQQCIDGWKQDVISTSKCLVLGVGGIGCSVAFTLARLGVGKVILIDRDKVETTNLNRQILYTPKHVGKDKVTSAKETLISQHVLIKNQPIIEAYKLDVLKDWDKVIAFAKECNVIFNCVDVGNGFDIACISLCMKLNIPYVSGSSYSHTWIIEYYTGKGIHSSFTYDNPEPNVYKILDKLKPDNILNYSDLNFIPYDANPPTRSIGSSVLVAGTAGIVCVNQWIQSIIQEHTMPNFTKFDMSHYWDKDDLLAWEMPVIDDETKNDETKNDETKNNETKNDDTKDDMSISTAKYKLNDGNYIPKVGLGLFIYARVKDYFSKQMNRDTSQNDSIMTKSEKEFFNAILYGYKYGYRHFDSAQTYQTESILGNILQNKSKYGIDRNDIFITTKVAPLIVNCERNIDHEIKQSFKNLNTNYIDLYLLHSPHSRSKKPHRGSDILNAYKALLKYNTKTDDNTTYIKSIGVSNFNVSHLERIKQLGLKLPAINQIEFHCFNYDNQTKKILKYCKENSITIEAYSPLARAHKMCKENKILKELASKYSNDNNVLTWAHIMLKWCLQKDVVILPKSVTESRISANANVFEFTISNDDMDRIDNITNENNSYYCSWQNNNITHPYKVEWDTISIDIINKKLKKYPE